MPPAKLPVYLPDQARHHLLPRLDFVPRWFIDCGPGSGGEALVMMEAFPDIRVIGVEPSPAGFREASRLWGGAGNLVEKAMWDAPDQKIELFGPEELLHSTSFYRGSKEGSILVETTSLDALDALYGPFEYAILWMDIEGAEANALRGGKDTFARGAVRAVNLEVRPTTEGELHTILLGYGLRKVSEYLVCETYRDEVWLL